MRERLRNSQLTPQQPQLHYGDTSHPPPSQRQQLPSTLSSSSSWSASCQQQQQQQQPPLPSSQTMPQQLQMPTLERTNDSSSGYPTNTQQQQQLLQPQNAMENHGTDTGIVTPLELVVDDADIAAGQTSAATKPISGNARNHHALYKDKHAQQPYVATLEKNVFTSHQAPTSANRNIDERPPLSSNSVSNHHYTSTTNRFNTLARPPKSANMASVASSGVYPSDLEFFEDMVSEPVLVLGVDISHLDRNAQFLVCASGVFGFSLLYGYLQELISVTICGRQLGLFLAMVQFLGYTVLAFFLRNFVYAKEQRRLVKKQRRYEKQNYNKKDDDEENRVSEARNDFTSINPHAILKSPASALSVPMVLYLGLSILRAIDLGMTNMAMQYINYPAKTLMKSSRVVFTMMFGVIISRKKYKPTDYAIVLAMVAGLALFMHADSNSSAVFDLVGVLMLTVSLLCDGAISNVSESIMSKFGVGQDEFIFRVYSIALVAITFAAVANGDFVKGFVWLLQPGTYDELKLPIEQRTWTVIGKFTVIILFSSMGFFGSSCSAAITKNFGALTMSITSTARKAATLFLSFFLFNNVCTLEHILGVVIFIAALTAKSLRRSRSDSKSSRNTITMPKSQSSSRPSLRRLSGNDNSSASSQLSLVSDLSDVEIAQANIDVCDTNIPAVVHTENLRSRTVSSPVKGNRAAATTL